MDINMSTQSNTSLGCMPATITTSTSCTCNSKPCICNNWTGGAGTYSPSNYGSNTIIGVGQSSFGFSYSQTVKYTNNKGEIYAFIDEDGFHTVINDLSNYTKAAVTDCVQIGDKYEFIWDILYGLRGVRQKGRSLVFDIKFARAIDLYIKTGKYAEMKIIEFVKKSAEDLPNTSKIMHMCHVPCGIKSSRLMTTNFPDKVTCRRCRNKLHL
jgi:hypothetical protein